MLYKYYLVHLVGRLLTVQGVRDSGVTVFALAYVETTGIILTGDISYGPRAMPHNLLLHLTLYVLYFLFYVPLRGCMYPPRPITMSARP